MRGGGAPALSGQVKSCGRRPRSPQPSPAEGCSSRPKARRHPPLAAGRTSAAAFGFVPLPARASGATAPVGKGKSRAKRSARRAGGPQPPAQRAANANNKPRLLAGQPVAAPGRRAARWLSRRFAGYGLKAHVFNFSSGGSQRRAHTLSRVAGLRPGWLRPAGLRPSFRRFGFSYSAAPSRFSTNRGNRTAPARRTLRRRKTRIP